MARLFLTLGAVAGLLSSTIAQRFANSSSESITVKWVGSTPEYLSGTTFGLPWSKGKHFPNSTQFSISGGVDLESWATAYWTDGSYKWTAHAIPETDSLLDEYMVTASSGATNSTKSAGLAITDSAEGVTVDTGKIKASFPKTGNIIVGSIETSGGKVVGQNGKLVLNSQSGVSADVESRGNSSIEYFNFESKIDNVTHSENSQTRALITVRGSHSVANGATHIDWLPFILRFYLYANSDAIRVVHTLVFDGDSSTDFITGIGLRFDVPLEGEELYNRHIRIAGVDGGLLSEAVKGITGLRRDPGAQVRQAQFEGEETPTPDQWDPRVGNATRRGWIPNWNDYSLSQLSPDGFKLKKRTQAGQSWVNIQGSTRSGGLAYLGGATQGGLAVGLRNFWQHYPTGLDIRNAATDTGEITIWIYSPEAEPLDLRPYHDGLGLDTYAKQLDALEVTYEDWEGGFDTPYGIARTNEFYIYAFDQTPARDHLSSLIEHTNNPPVLFADSEYIHETKALGTWWAPRSADASSGLASRIESNLDFLASFYRNQVEQRRWYGIFDAGDIMHTYDTDRHQWRYDIGGYAWDNSELSPDLFFWPYFLRTGDADAYRFAEALTRHTGEVDSYHLGKWKGLGTRHGVQHWGDSAKQARISTAQYRKIFYFISGGDERVGELVQETLDTDKTYETLDPNRKVRTDGFVPAPGERATIGLGTDWSGLAASWLLEWERRGPRAEEAKLKLTNTLTSIVALKNGFVTGSGLYNSTDGTLDPPPTDPDNEGVVAVSHLSGVFGLGEVVAELIEHYGDDLPEGFEQTWLDYCYYYRAPAAEQQARYGGNWTRTATLRQGHSRLLAYGYYRTGNESWAQRAWSEFEADGLNTTDPWELTRFNGSEVLAPIDEVAWLSTNDAANYGLAAIVNLAYIPEFLPESLNARVTAASEDEGHDSF
ncbi:putative yetA-like protein [Septoria linicola]|nr:putative yetA-like protein [Septoria linicola]